MHRSLLSASAVPAAVAGNAIAASVTAELANAGHLSVQFKFTYGSGGTTATYWLQTSLDGGATWFDIACVQFGTASAVKIVNIDAGGYVSPGYVPGDGVLAVGSVVDGIIGDRLRIKQTIVGTYAASAISVDVVDKAGIGTQKQTLGQAAASASVPVVDATDTWTSPDNGIVSVTNSSTTLLAAASAGVRRRNAILYNAGAQTVTLREGAAPTVGTHFPLVAGATLTVETLLAVNGIVASGTCNVAVLSEAAS